MSDPTKYDDTIDSRDVITRLEVLLEELRDEFDELISTGEIPEDADFEAWCSDQADDSDARLCDEANEHKVLSDLAEQCEGYGDWAHGETLIRDSYFSTYCEELAEEIGAIDPDAKWPLNCIDWEAAADALKIDYTSLDFDGVDYWMRA